MAVVLECPSCTCRFRIEESFRGTRVSCPKCGQEVPAVDLSAGESEPAVTLTAEHGPISGQTFRFTEHDTFIFGRGSSCHASLPKDSFVSRYHFILEVNPPQSCVRHRLSVVSVLRQKFCPAT